MGNANPFKYDLRSRSVSSRDYDRLVRAAHLAFSGEHDRVRVGALVARGRKVFGAGANTSRNPVENVPFGHVTVHAEMNALAETPWAQRKGATIYVSRLGSGDQPLASFPCDRCMTVIRQAGVREIVYFDGNAVVKVRIV